MSQKAKMVVNKKVYATGKTYFVLVKEHTSNTGFYDDACYDFYLRRLEHSLNTFQIKLHAFVLRSTDIWLLVTPVSLVALESLLLHLNHSYNNYFYIRFDRHVKVWSDSPVVSLIPSNKLVLDCQKFVERSPLRARLVSHPGQYLWSSYCFNSFSRKTHYLTPHAAFSRFLKNNRAHLAQYRDFVAAEFGETYYRFLEYKLLNGIPLVRRRQHKEVSI